MTEPVRKQASLTPKLGGLGLRRTVDHATLAFYASWTEAKSTSKEDWWTEPEGWPAKHPHQSAASFAFDVQVHEALIKDAEAAGKPREQRLRRCAQPHSGGFITALPSKHDGFDTILMPKTFRTAVYYRLGIPVLDKEIDCPTCKQTINIYGDHATC